MLSRSKELFEKWNICNVRYCHWKSNEHLNDGLDGNTDVDVFVHPEDKHITEDVLNNLCYIKLLVQIGSRYTNVDEWIGFDYDTGKLIHIHLHYNLITGMRYSKEYVFPWNDLAISSRILDKETGVYLISPNLELIILYCRMILKNKKINSIPNEYKREREYLINKVDLYILKDYCKNLFGEYGEIVIEIITNQSNNWTKLRKIIIKILRPYRRYQPLIVEFRSLYYKFILRYRSLANSRLYALHITRKVLPGGGMSIAFLGVDGSGKSTMTKEIEKWLCWKIDSRRIYLGSGDHYNSLLKLLLKKLKSKSTKNKNMNTGIDNLIKNEIKQGKGIFTTLIQFIKKCFGTLNAYYYIEVAKHAYKMLKKTKKYIKKGGIVLFDRFPQCQFEGINDGLKITPANTGFFMKYMMKWERNIFSKISVYEPNIVFKLQISVDESLRRKPTESIKEIKDKVDIVKQLVFTNSQNYMIDAAQDYENELLEVKRIIWSQIINYR